MNIQKGTNYEIYICNYLKKNYKDNDVFLWNETPYFHLYNMGLVNNSIDQCMDQINDTKDIGCDIVMYDKINSKYTIVQCKNYTDKNICVADISGFSFLVATTDVHGLLISTTKTSQLICKLIGINNKIKHCIVPYENTILELSVPNIIKPYEYQIEAYNKIKDIDRCILQLPCGMGKTLVAGMVAKHYDNIIILSPYRPYSEQLLERFKEYLPDYNNILIDCDHDRDEVIIKKKLKIKNIICSTYKSADIVNKIISSLTNVYIIVDEFHNLSQNNVLNVDDELNKIIISKNKILFMSATPKIYELIDKNIQYDNNKIFGNIEYSYEFEKAIKEKYINDFQIVVADKNNKYDKYEYIYYNLLYFGYKKCIIYTQNVANAKTFVTKLTAINNEKYKLNLMIGSITCETKMSKRQTLLKDFVKNDSLSILVAVRILDECIDIPSCDSIYISYNCTSEIRTVQRMSRSLRIKESKPISGIFLWNNVGNNLSYFTKSVKDYNIIVKSRVTSIETHIKKDNVDKETLIKDYKFFDESNIDNNRQNENNNILLFYDYINQKSNIPTQFINDFYSIYNNTANLNSNIDLDMMSKWLNTRKDTIKKTILRSYILNIDYTIFKINNINKSGPQIIKILLTNDCFTKICMLSQSKNAEQIRTYLIELNKLKDQYKNYIIQNLNSQMTKLQ